MTYKKINKTYAYFTQSSTILLVEVVIQKLVDDFFLNLLIEVPLFSRYLFNICITQYIYCACFSVPSRAPPNVRLSNLDVHDIKVQWDPLPEQYANGQLLGYRVSCYENYDIYSWRFKLKTVANTSRNAHTVTMRGLKEATFYRISVAAFTSKGVGPRSYSNITTGKSNFSFWVTFS